MLKNNINPFVTPFIFSLVVILIGAWRIFTPQLSANYGLGWDGWKYYDIAVLGLDSPMLDSYLALRIFPSYLIHTVFKLLEIPFSPANVILAFKIMNTCLLGLSAWMVQRIFEHYRLLLITQYTGLALIFLNYGVLNFTYYYPVMTDTPAFFLSIALFYFFIKGELINVFLTGLIGAFTWPLLFAMAIALILFPQKEIKFLSVSKPFSIGIGILSLLYGVLMGYYLIFIKKEHTDLPFTLPLNYGMLPVAFAVIALIYFLIPSVLINKTFLYIDYYRSQLNVNSFFAAASLVVSCLLIYSAMNVTAASDYLSFYHQIKIHLLYAFQRPFITLASHFNYFGCILPLMIIFWRRFSRFISQFGLGVAGSVFIALFIFFMKPESRSLIFLFPWLMILMTLFLGQFRFPKIFHALIFSVNFIATKLWLFFDDKNAPVLSDGTIGFPAQWFYMHLGIWMTETVWLWLCAALSVTLLLLFISLYKIRLAKKNILFYPKFSPIAYD